MRRHDPPCHANHHLPHLHLATSPPPPVLAGTSLRDAAQLWLITAKEGSVLAARELGLFYLTHPELVPRVTSPFSKAKDVFRGPMVSDHRGSGVPNSGGGGGGGSIVGGGGGGGSTAPAEEGGLDARTFAVVFHWMEVAANGGDKDARDFLRGNGELSGGK